MIFKKIMLPLTQVREKKPKEFSTKMGYLKILIILILVILTFSFSYVLLKFKYISSVASLVSFKQQKDEMQQTNLQNLSKLMWLPKESKPPRVFEITDPIALSDDQSFYEGSIRGDILVIFDQSKKAIIYSPKRNVIINSGTFVYNVKTDILESNQ